MAVQVQAQPTPNPNAVKFALDRHLTQGTSRTFGSAAEAASDPLAARLFAVPGVKMLFILNDFVSVTREPGADWNAIVPAVESAIREHFAD